MRFGSQFARFQNWDEEYIATREIVSSKMNGPDCSTSSADDPADPLGPSPFTGGTADLSSTGEAPF